MWTAVVLFAAGALISFAALRVFRTTHAQPFFYQESLGPAVLMTCGYGFRAISVEDSPPSLRNFLALARDDFDCADLGPAAPVQAVTWNSTAYYLYAAIALVWKAAGISWAALDTLVAGFAGIVTAALYGLFRFVAGPWMAAAMALLLTLSPANLTALPGLRDYAKAPFVLAAALVLSLIVLHPMRARRLAILAAVYGAIVGFGYGFRPDVLIMMPFGLVVLLALAPAPPRMLSGQRLTAALVMLFAFSLVAAPALRGLGTSGGCQFHFPLLGLTTPFTDALGVKPSIYAIGDHFTDTFVDLKTGDYAQRVLNAPPPLLCSADYDTASGGLFLLIARTFPADLLVRGYASSLGILRAGVTVPTLPGSFTGAPWLKSLVGRLNAWTDALSILGPVVTALAVGVAWTFAPRLGVAVGVFVLFLSAYPAIQFEARHWFHLRFIPLWAALLVLKRLRSTSSGAEPLRPFSQGVGVSVAAVLSLAFILAGARVVQAGEVAALVRAYETAAVEDLPLVKQSDSSVDVVWQPSDYGTPPGRRSSDLLVITVDSNGCGATGPLDVRIRYDADVRTHDIGTAIRLDRGARGTPPTHLFVPIFSQGVGDHSYLRFTGLDVLERSSDCITRLARVSDRSRLPLWLQLQVPPDWTQRPLYQTLRIPPFTE